MGIFSRTKQSTTAPSATTKPGKRSALTTDVNRDAIILKPRLTEKSLAQGDVRVYTFMVAKRATKHAVKQAITAIYNVTPVKVNIVNSLPRQTMSRAKGRIVSHAGYKKAYVYLKEGDSISLV